MTVNYEFELGGFPGIFCELLWVQPDELFVRYYPDLNDEFDLTFRNRYASGDAAKASLSAFIKSVPVLAAVRSNEPRDWNVYERQVNTSVIALIKAFLGGELPLPDGGAGFRSAGSDPKYLRQYIDQWDAGEYIQFVDFSRYGR